VVKWNSLTAFNIVQCPDASLNPLHLVVGCATISLHFTSVPPTNSTGNDDVLVITALLVARPHHEHMEDHSNPKKRLETLCDLGFLVSDNPPDEVVLGPSPHTSLRQLSSSVTDTTSFREGESKGVSSCPPQTSASHNRPLNHQFLA
jgi:hypothetical protein